MPAIDAVSVSDLPAMTEPPYSPQDAPAPRTEQVTLQCKSVVVGDFSSAGARISAPVASAKP
jgi:hypothetical protein